MSAHHRTEDPADRPREDRNDRLAAEDRREDPPPAEHRADTPPDRHVDDRTIPPEGGAAAEEAVIAREQEIYGGVKIGAAFFGWLTAVGIGVLLTAVVVATGTAIGVAAEDVEVNATVETVGTVGAIILIAIMFLAYFCGGYVAGRMARFDGAKQGMAVWLWALVIAVIVAIIGAIAGDQYNVFAEVNVYPRLPIDEGTLTTAGIVAAILWLVASLAGAVLGGITGVRYHRKVDHAGFVR